MSGNEAVAIGTMRTINTAQANYYQQCEGYAPNLLELESAGEFLPPNLSGSVTVTRSGYSITVEPAGTASLGQDPPPGCAGTVTDFFAHADPLTPGATGTRHFATDARGTIYQSEGRMADTDGAMPVQ